MRALQRIILVLFLLAWFPSTLALVAVSEFGYHPVQQKQVVVYTGATSGTFTIKDSTTNAIVHTGTLAKPKNAGGADTTCQGGQTCLVGDFTSFSTQGTYYIEANNERSQTFRIGSNVFALRAPLFLEFFEALRQQGSAYHANLHAAQQPPFPMMGDGSPIMTTHMATTALARMTSAYQRNPTLFGTDKYTLNRANTPDIAEDVRAYVDYLIMLQDYDSSKSVTSGYYYDFGCAPDYDPNVERYNTQQDTCLQYHSDTPIQNAAEALYGYSAAIAIIYSTEGSASAQSLLNRAVATRDYIKSSGTPTGDAAAYYGAALFILYDHTANAQYLQEAHALRTSVSTSLSASQTYGNEFYWQEYARHKSAIESAGLPYPYNGAEQIFANKIESDWSSGSKPIAGYGERLYVMDESLDFSHSRSMLIEALFAAKARQYGAGSTNAKTVADMQLAWITGMNSVQDGDGVGPMRSYSFLFGVGSNGKAQHTRLVYPTFYSSGATYNNGAKFIPGWISGSLDSYNDADKIFNYHDDWNNWRYAETTNEIVGAGMELIAYLDAQYNGKAPLARTLLSGSCTPSTEVCDGIDNNCNGQVDENNVCGSTSTCGNHIVEAPEQCDDGNTQNGDGCSSTCTLENSCYNRLQQIPATCTGGTITQDTVSGCRTIICSSGANSLKVLACEKPDSGTPTRIEMYKQAQSGSGLKICLGSACLQNEGFTQANLPMCTSPPTCTPSTEVCDGKDNNCNGQVDENNVCGSTSTCGNHIVEAPEQCDDGNTQNGDGCSSTCTLENSCYNRLQQIPSSCVGGTITQDLFSGCRTITCASGANSLKVLACEKPDGIAPQYFEIYKQAQTGSGLKICLAGSCLQNEGYVKSPNFPICTGPPTCTPTTEICDGKDNNCNGQVDENNVCGTPTGVSATPKIAPWYPKGRDYVFVCDTTGFTPTTYDWSFGDGNAQYGRTVKDVYYRYTSAGSYNVKCTAKSSTTSASGTLAITVA